VGGSNGVTARKAAKFKPELASYCRFPVELVPWHAMSREGNRIVWILGSGFSRALGGPLLNELLTRKGGLLAMARFGDDEEKYRRARDAFTRHLGRGRRLWENAEEFLDLLDQARHNNGLAKLILSSEGNNTTLQELWEDACLAIADECRFCDVTRQDGEAWKPYKRWAKAMGALDFIITFNYDEVLEKLGYRVPCPPISDAEFGTRDVLKLHGSVTWSLDGNRIVDGLQRGQGVPFIATPGPTKLSYTDRGGKLASLWDNARAVLTNADAIVFIGYRFPPTDSHALSSILEAVFENGSPVLRIHTVLGPRTNDDDTVRLKTLLLRTMRASGRRLFTGNVNEKAYCLQVHPLYAQDFMATFSEAELLAPNNVDYQA